MSENDSSQTPAPVVAARSASSPNGPVVVFDVETKNLFDDVGGFRNTNKLGLAVAVTYDADAVVYREFTEKNVDELIEQLFGARLVVGFNTIKFDYRVIGAYTKRRFNMVPTLDIFDHLYRRTGYRSKLDTVVKETLGEGKSGDGLEANAWWKEGKVDKVMEYCRDDVRLTYELYKYGKEQGAVFTRDKRGGRVRIPVMW